MRTNIDIDDELLTAAMQATGQTTKRGTVEEALRRVVMTERRRQAIENMVGIEWIGPDETWPVVGTARPADDVRTARPADDEPA